MRESGDPLESLTNKHQIHKYSLEYIGKIILEVEEQNLKWIIPKLCLISDLGALEIHIVHRGR